MKRAGRSSGGTGSRPLLRGLSLRLFRGLASQAGRLHLVAIAGLDAFTGRVQCRSEFLINPSV